MMRKKRGLQCLLGTKVIFWSLLALTVMSDLGWKHSLMLVLVTASCSALFWCNVLKWVL